MSSDLFLADPEMSFDPSKLLANVHHNAKGPMSKAPASKKGKKRARHADVRVPEVPLESSVPRRGQPSTSRSPTSTPRPKTKYEDRA